MKSRIEIPVEVTNNPRFSPCDAGEICERCAWFFGKQMYAGYGHCRRHAPNHRADFYQGAWPYVKPDDWCGDFTRVLKMKYPITKEQE